MRTSKSIRTARSIRLLPVAVVALLCTACPPDIDPVEPDTTIVVTTTADVIDGGDGLLSLREAMAEASSDGIDSSIRVVAGATYALTDCGAASLRHDEGHALMVSTGGGGRATVRQTCPQRVFTLGGGAVELRHLVIRGGRMGSSVNC